MDIKGIYSKTMRNKERTVIYLCFSEALCFNILCGCALCFYMFTYDGMADIKSYMDIKTTEMAHDFFLHDILLLFGRGLTFSFPLIWGCLFTRRINLNAILMQLLPVLLLAW